MSDLTWLQAHAFGFEPKSCPALAKPFSILAKRPYECATDGRALVAVEGDALAHYPLLQDQTVVDACREYLTPATSGRITTRATLRAWCGIPGGIPCSWCDDARVITCQNCLGTGKENTSCSTCGHDHECVCVACHEGKTECRCVLSDGDRYGHLDGIVVNRNHLAKAMTLKLARGRWIESPIMGADEVSVSTNRDSIAPRVQIVGHGWIVVLMGVKNDGSYMNAPVFGDALESGSSS